MMSQEGESALSDRNNRVKIKSEPMRNLLGLKKRPKLRQIRLNPSCTTVAFAQRSFKNFFGTLNDFFCDNSFFNLILHILNYFITSCTFRLHAI